MTITKFTCFLNGFLEKKEAVLCRLTTNIWNPGLNFRDSESLDLTFEKDIARRPFSDVQSLTSASTSSKLSVLLTKFVTIFVSHSANATDDISTPMAITYKLLNTDDKFEEVCKDTSVQKWLEKAIQYRKDVFFIIGFATLSGAEVNTTNEEESAANVAAQAPVTALATHGASETLPPATADVLDVKGQIDHKRHLATAATFTAPGERVIAIEYQKLEFKPFSSKNVESAQLGKPRWQVFATNRGAAVDDSIEASLGSLEESNIPQLSSSPVEISASPDGDIFVVDGQSL